MKFIDNIREMAETARKIKSAGKSIGLVPTMGYLHEGHMSLVRRSRRENEVTVLSIFVNPTQFGPNEDLDKYPRDLSGDLARCEAEGVDIVFAPTASAMYPEGYGTFVSVEGVSEGLCGTSRPGHFRGVATVVNKLFNIAMPDKAYFGAKDFQQTAVVRRMASDLNMAVEVIVCPTVREADGLAISSRNSFLSSEERKAALSISRGLKKAGEVYKSGEKDTARLKEAVLQEISGEPILRVDYIECVDPDSIKSVHIADKTVLIAVAVFAGGTRLIDNALI
ncbi:MAG TPA: pantoate--beta-alanine ligase [Nitrospirota bacterium]|jgi:pantoate--beta-alanine ligase